MYPKLNDMRQTMAILDRDSIVVYEIWRHVQLQVSDVQKVEVCITQDVLDKFRVHESWNRRERLMYNKDWLREYGQGMFRVKEASWVEA